MRSIFCPLILLCRECWRRSGHGGRPVTSERVQGRDARSPHVSVWRSRRCWRRFKSLGDLISCLRFLQNGGHRASVRGFFAQGHHPHRSCHSRENIGGRRRPSPWARLRIAAPSACLPGLIFFSNWRVYCWLPDDGGSGGTAGLT